LTDSLERKGSLVTVMIASTTLTVPGSLGSLSNSLSAPTTRDVLGLLFAKQVLATGQNHQPRSTFYATLRTNRPEIS
jgi:hypothetical protein